VAADHKDSAQFVGAAPGDLDGGLDVGNVLKQDDELVAAKAGNCIDGAHRAQQTVAHRGEQQIARVVAEAVVDDLEAVEIEKEDGDGVAVSARAGVRQTTEKERAVGEPTEGIMEGLVGQPGVRRGVGARRDGGRPQDDPGGGRPAAAGGSGVDAASERDARAIGGEEDEFDGLGDASGRDGGEDLGTAGATRSSRGLPARAASGPRAARQAPLTWTRRPRASRTRAGSSSASTMAPRASLPRPARAAHPTRRPATPAPVRIRARGV